MLRGAPDAVLSLSLSFSLALALSLSPSLSLSLSCPPPPITHHPHPQLRANGEPRACPSSPPQTSGPAPSPILLCQVVLRGAPDAVHYAQVEFPPTISRGAIVKKYPGRGVLLRYSTSWNLRLWRVLPVKSEKFTFAISPRLILGGSGGCLVPGRGCPYGGVRPCHRKTSCLTQLTSGPYILGHVSPCILGERSPLCGCRHSQYMYLVFVSWYRGTSPIRKRPPP